MYFSYLSWLLFLSNILYLKSSPYGGMNVQDAPYPESPPEPIPEEVQNDYEAAKKMINESNFAHASAARLSGRTRNNPKQ